MSGGMDGMDGTVDSEQPAYKSIAGAVLIIGGINPYQLPMFCSVFQFLIS